MKSKERLRFPSRELTEFLITKMLEKHNVDFDHVLKNQMIDGEDWFSYYTFTQKEHDDYETFFIDYIRTKVINKATKKQAQKEFRKFDLMWGLKIKE